MTTNELVALLRTIAAEAPDLRGEAKWYLFGSALRDARRAADFDVAIVCPAELAAVIRTHLAPACRRWPIHLTILSPQEDADLRFTKEQGAVCFYP